MLKLIAKILIVAIGALVGALALNLFLVPVRLAPGGVSGISTVVYHLSGISVGILIFVINIPIFILGFVNFGKRFVAWSVVGTFALSLFVFLTEWVLPVTEDLLLASVFGGALLGLGLGVVIRVGATTGGSDIVAKSVYKRFPAVSIGQFILIVDILVIAFAGIVFGQWEIILYSGIALYISSKVIDAVVEGLDFAKAAFIISDKSEEIGKYVLEQMGRGVTGLSGCSLYTGRDRMVLMCVIKKHEINRLKSAIREIDPHAFVVLSDAREVLGQGFKEAVE